MSKLKKFFAEHNISFLILAVAIVMVAGYIVPLLPARWKIVEWDDKNFEYSVSYVHDTCIVSLHANGDGVMVTAVDPDWYGRILKQAFEIRNDEGGAYKRESFWVVSDSYDGRVPQVELNPHTYPFDTIGYDVFWAKCSKAAKSLPPKVKKAFLGYYGLK